ncbi:hypothetical protein H8K32_15990 [Undibacterium jejuense]|uniref:Uncharacterized protein n=1 Tax=Undibacterium jejuense TaxID=1344949 RepID=A0A923KQ81_9BURK|nr:hypothetical protein [Undibacterium jejuense]MBC3863608.1 hypothetical protein [Undibacterium jejuense]
MSKHSQYLVLAKVTEGMVLADDLLDKVGHVLLPAGVTLTASMLKSLAHHHVQQLCIEKETVNEQEVEAERQLKLGRIAYLFRLQPDQEPANALKQYLIHYREGEIL